MGYIYNSESSWPGIIRANRVLLTESSRWLRQPTIPKTLLRGENTSRLPGMKRDEVISKLRAHEAELRAAGIVRIAVFGSVARGDVDLLADFDKTRHYTLLTMGRLESRLADLLGTRVDLSSPEWLKESVRNQAMREAVLAF